MGYMRPYLSKIGLERGLSKVLVMLTRDQVPYAQTLLRERERERNLDVVLCMLVFPALERWRQV